jgi:YVTN family beta-propeller protein
LRDLSLLRADRITLDVADRPVNMPFALALDRFSERLYVANAGSNSVSVIDLNTGLARAHLDVGANPRGILLSRDNTLLYVHSVLDGTLMTFSTNDLSIVNVQPLVNLTTSLELLIGAQHFHSAVDPRLSAGGRLSCATCHFDGLSDGRVWIGFPDGARNTPTLYALLETVPYTWSGTWDELADAELKVRDLQAGTGLIEDALVSPPLGNPHAGLSPDLDLLTRYLTSLQAPPSPYQADSAVIERGATVYEERGCADCHVGTTGTDLQLHDVGTGTLLPEQHGSPYDTPQLRWLWLSAPYFHDGSAAMLHDVFELEGTHQLIYNVSPQDIDALVAYLLTLPTEAR